MVFSFKIDNCDLDADQDRNIYVAADGVKGRFSNLYVAVYWDIR